MLADYAEAVPSSNTDLTNALGGGGGFGGFGGGGFGGAGGPGGVPSASHERGRRRGFRRLSRTAEPAPRQHDPPRLTLRWSPWQRSAWTR